MPLHETARLNLSVGSNNEQIIKNISNGRRNSGPVWIIMFESKGALLVAAKMKDYFRPRMSILIGWQS